MLVKTSIVCFIMILYMVGFYYRKPHIPTKSTRIFQALTIVALLNTMFDLITIYTVNHRDRIHEGVNLIAHIIYLMSILGTSRSPDRAWESWCCPSPMCMGVQRIIRWGPKRMPCT